MKISVEWLREYIDLRETPAQLKDDLTSVGLVVESLEELDGDTVLDIEVTSNRPDCLNYVGVARELDALYGRPLKRPRVGRLRPAGEELPCSIEILDADLCPRYLGLVVAGLRVGPSPQWMQRRLEASGMRPVNNIVDVTNYVLLELGHPLHAFDYEKLRGRKIVVARAGRQQKFTTLDGVEREIDPDMLLINDGEGPVAVAGVMGGLDSEVSLSTHTVLLECAYFQPASIRRTSKRLGLSTEASYRFERGTDWNAPPAAIARTCGLLRRLAGGRVAAAVRDIYPKELEPVSIDLDRARAERLLGVGLKDEFVASTLRSLSFSPRRLGKGRWRVECPTWRADMELEADLIEEVARFFGYQNIPTTLPASVTVGKPSLRYSFERDARRMLRGLGYSEAVNYSFAGEDDIRTFPAGADTVTILNPLTEDTRYLRPLLAPGLLRSARHNFNHGRFDVRLFEIGKIYRRAASGAIEERNTLGIAGTGSHTGRNWRHPGVGYDFFHLKGALTAFLDAMHSAEYNVVPGADAPWLNPEDASRLVIGGETVGVLGSLHPARSQEMKLKQPVFLAEIDFEALSKHLFTPIEFHPLPKYPEVERDLSVVIPRRLDFAAVRDGILSLRIAELIRIELIDVYQGSQIPSGKVSMTLRFIFQDPEGTLTVDRVQSFSDNIRSYLREHHGAEFR